jgi:hypothetical protein
MHWSERNLGATRVDIGLRQSDGDGERRFIGHTDGLGHRKRNDGQGAGRVRHLPI